MNKILNELFCTYIKKIEKSDSLKVYWFCFEWNKNDLNGKNDLINLLNKNNIRYKDLSILIETSNLFSFQILCNKYNYEFIKNLNNCTGFGDEYQ
jgi:hypothetical protein